MDAQEQGIRKQSKPVQLSRSDIGQQEVVQQIFTKIRCIVAGLNQKNVGIQQKLFSVVKLCMLKVMWFWAYVYALHIHLTC